MGLEQALRRCFAKYADFTGRAGLAEFWWFLFGIEALACLTLCLAVISPPLAPLGAALLGLSVPPGLAVTVRRLHDLELPGAWALAVLVPVAGLVLLLRWLARPGIAGENRYGTPPDRLPGHWRAA